jgi:hypothetical protein
MSIGDFLVAVREGYSLDSVASDGHSLLARAKDYFEPFLPAGLVVRGSGGKGKATFTPWVAILDPDETTSPQHGIYLVYIFKAGLNEVVLTLNQGITNLVEQLGTRDALAVLRERSDRIRASLSPFEIEGLATKANFESNGFRQRAYGAGNIVSKTYRIGDMPDDATLEEDLEHFVRLYQVALFADRTGGLLPSLIATAPQAELFFKPKSDLDYVQRLTGGYLRKSRRHETLIAAYGPFAHKLGYKPSTSVHPRDLTLHRNEVEWLVEAKVVYCGNATEAVRGAFAQLATYSHFLYRTDAPPRQLALFTEPIGDAHVGFLEAHGVASVWKGDLTWNGSPIAIREGLA